MTLNLTEREMLRGRGRRARQSPLLADPYADDFATGGLAQRANVPSVSSPSCRRIPRITVWGSTKTCGMVASGARRSRQEAPDELLSLSRTD